MSAQPPQALEGSQAPSQIEFLWERYRPWVLAIVVGVFAALGVNYVLKYLDQKKVDAAWSGLATAVKLDAAYTKEEPSYLQASLAEEIEKVDLAKIEAAAASASDAQKPFLLLALARKAMGVADWARAESALAELESKFPNHSLVKTSGYPLQTREQVDPKAKPTTPQKPPELKPAAAGSAVGRMREQIAAARNYSRPEHFQQIKPHQDAARVRFEFSNGAAFVIAMMPDYAPKHVEAFLALAAQEGGYWKDMAVDEILRPTTFGQQPREMHLGFATTREDDRTKWTTTDPSSQVLDFEASDLSHFAGAVSGRNEADGKSCADRFWVVADDAPRHDGERVIFGFVVEGLDQVRRICEESMSAQEEQAGRGRPTENIRVTAVTVL
ncbi:MAG: peptidylprolyl isomerase [Planctomycetes bacterium]|nr:peptidylprolyl isomerase [Planctomycetota bacterium]